MNDLEHKFGGAGGGGHTPKIKKDNLLSDDIVELTLGLCEGPIAGLIYGPQSFYLGDTPLMGRTGENNFKPFELHFYSGDTDATPVRNILGGVASNTQVNVKLATDTSVTRLTDQALRGYIDQLEVRIMFNALSESKKNGDQVEATVEFQVEYRPVGETEWASFYTDRTLKLTGKTSSGYARDFIVQVPRIDTDWEIRVTKVSPEDNPRIQNIMTWDSFQMVTKENKKYDDLAVIRAVGQASDQFTGLPQFSGVYGCKIIKIPSNYDVMTRYYDGIWDGTFKMAMSDNPAWVLYDLLTNEKYGARRFFPGLQVDRFSFYEAAKWCDEFVPRPEGGYQPRWTYNDVIDQERSGLETIYYIAGVIGAVFVKGSNGIVSIRLDKPEPPVQIFGPESATPEGFSYQFTDTEQRPNEILVKFTNPDLDWSVDVRRVADQGWIDRNGRKTERLIAIGCNDVYEAQRRAFRRLLQANTETTTVSFQTTRAGMHLQIFDVIGVVDPTMDWGVSGRVKTPPALWRENASSTYPAGPTGQVVRVNFKGKIENPIITLSGVYNDDVFTMRIIDRDDYGFTYTVDELPYQDATITSDLTINWMAMPEGVYTLPNGQQIQATRVDVAAYDRGGAVLNYDPAFTAKPAVFTTVSSHNFGVGIYPRAETGDTSATLSFDMQESTIPPIGTETLDVIVMSVQGDMSIAVNEPASSDVTYNFAESHTNPIVNISCQTVGGADPGIGLITAMDGTSATIFFQEDLSNDTETNHAAETFAVLVLDEGPLWKDTVQLRDPLYLPTGADITMTLQTKDGPVDVTVQTQTPVTKELTITAGQWPSNLPDRAQFALSATGIGLVKPFRILSIEEDQEVQGLYSITALEQNVNKYGDVDNMVSTGTVDYVSDMSGLPPAPAITGVESGTGQLYINSDGKVISRILVEWEPNPKSLTTELQLFYRQVGVEGFRMMPASGRYAYIDNVRDGAEYEIFMRAVGAFNKVGLPSETVTHTVIGKTEPPEDVINLTTQQGGANVRLSFDKVSDLDLDFYEIRAAAPGTLWEEAETLGTTTATSYVHYNVAFSPIEYQVRAVDTTGNMSLNAATATHVVSAPSRPGATFSLEQSNFVINISPDQTDEVPVTNYIVRQSGNIIFEGKASRFSGAVSWSGARSFDVSVVNSAGIESPALTLVGTISAPSAPVLEQFIADTSYYISWTPPSSSLPLLGYRIKDETNNAILSSQQQTTIFSGVVTWAGIRQISVTPIDVAWNMGPTVTINVEAPAPTIENFTSDVSKSTVKLSWLGVKQALPIDQYELRRGASYATSTKVAELDAMTYSLPVDWNGSETFWLTATDTAGNKSTPISIVEAIDPPNTPTVSAQLVGQNIHLSWTDATNELRLDSYQIYAQLPGEAQPTKIQTVNATATSIAATFLGIANFFVEGVDEAGNVGSQGSAAVTISAPASFAFNALVNDRMVELSWVKPAATLPIVEYELRRGATFETSSLVTTTASNSFSFPVDWGGTESFFIIAYDSAGNPSPTQSTDVTITAPTAPTPRSEVIDNNVLLRWSNGAGSLPIVGTEIRKGDTWDTAEIQQIVDATFASFFEFKAGSFKYWLANYDTAGNQGTPVSITTVVNEPPDFVLQNAFSSDFSGTKSNLIIDETGGLLLGLDPTQTYEGHFEHIEFGTPDWTGAQGTTGSSGVGPTRTVDTIFAFRELTLGAAPDGILFEAGANGDGGAVWFDAAANTIGASFGAGGAADTTGLVHGSIDATSMKNKTVDVYAAVRVSPTGRMKLMVYDHDTQALLGETSVTTAGEALGSGSTKEWGGTDAWGVGRVGTNVTDWATSTGVFNGTMPHGVEIYSNALPVDFDTDADPGFVYWTKFYTPQDQIDLGMPIYIQPTNEALDSFYQEEVDLEVVIGSSIITVTPTVLQLAGNASVEVDIEYRQTTADPWQMHANQTRVYAQNFRYLRFTVRYAGDSADDLLRVDRIDVRLNVKLRNDAGSGTASAADVNGTQVNFNVSFVDVASITVTPNTTSQVTAVYDFTDTQNPTGFTVYLFDKNGNRVSGDFSWAVRGY